MAKRIVRQPNKETYTTKFMLYLAASCLFICFMYIFLITFLEIPKENQRYADLCLGFLLGTFMATIIQFFFGSSNSSKMKDEEIKKMTTEYQDNVSKLQTISDITEVLNDTVEEENEKEEPKQELEGKLKVEGELEVKKTKTKE